MDLGQQIVNLVVYNITDRIIKVLSKHKSNEPYTGYVDNYFAFNIPRQFGKTTWSLRIMSMLAIKGYDCVYVCRNNATVQMLKDKCNELGFDKSALFFTTENAIEQNRVRGMNISFILFDDVRQELVDKWRADTVGIPVKGVFSIGSY